MELKQVDDTFIKSLSKRTAYNLVAFMHAADLIINQKETDLLTTKEKDHAKFVYEECEKELIRRGIIKDKGSEEELE